MARILVIDDDDEFRTMVSQLLQCEGHRVIEAADGAQGVTSLRDSLVDLVITDILMPNKEGMETIVEIRETHPGLRIIAMSGGLNGKDTSILGTARQLGADALLKKPFGSLDLSEAVNACLA